MIKTAAEGASAEAEKSQTVILALGELRKEIGALTEDSQVDRHGGAGSRSGGARSAEGRRDHFVGRRGAGGRRGRGAAQRRAAERGARRMPERDAIGGRAWRARSVSDGGAEARINWPPPPSSCRPTVQEISGAARQIMIAVEQISRGGQQQAAATQQASAAMDQIEKTAQAAQRECRRSRSIAPSRHDACWRKSASRFRRACRRASTRSLETTRRSLGTDRRRSKRVSRSVDKIVDGIGMVSIQTNMLAVSGSVEAARAGDFGKGFAVVSKDIRNLARDSGENAGRIKDTVRAIQDQIAAVRRDLEQIVAAAEAENQKNAAVLSNLDCGRGRHGRARRGQPADPGRAPMPSSRR